MAPSLLPLLSFFLALSPFLQALAAKTTPAAPAPAPAPLNLTAILEKGGQYGMLIRLLKETQIGNQIETQLNNSYNGLTLFAPSDNAFAALKPGTLNALSAQQQAALLLYHILPRYYTLEMFETVSNPVQTQATGNNGAYVINITSSNNQANVSTGIDHTRLGTALYDDFPLAVYPVDAVLLPYDLFGPKPPASAPPPAAAPPKEKKRNAPSRVPAAESATSTPSAAGSTGRGVGWGTLVGVGMVVSIGWLQL